MPNRSNALVNWGIMRNLCPQCTKDQLFSAWIVLGGLISHFVSFLLYLFIHLFIYLFVGARREDYGLFFFKEAIRYNHFIYLLNICKIWLDAYAFKILGLIPVQMVQQWLDKVSLFQF
jgi:hypothetical protein